eukprot:3145940-Prymnesium_polylepis.1
MPGVGSSVRIVLFLFLFFGRSATKCWTTFLERRSTSIRTRSPSALRSRSRGGRPPPLQTSVLSAATSSTRRCTFAPTPWPFRRRRGALAPRASEIRATAPSNASPSQNVSEGQRLVALHDASRQRRVEV